jgi:uncharacterized low-complexity protein
METKKTILTGTAIATAILGAASMKANTSNLFDFTSLGSGSEVRANLVNAVPSAVKFSDLSCGDKKDAKAKEGEHKSKDAKCGDSKTKEASSDKKAHDGAHKSKDGKCGEGKCGDKKTANPK